MKRYIAILAVLLCATGRSSGSEEPRVVELWPGKAPEELGAYRSFVLDLARAVSAAAEGGDEAEAAVIAQVEQALDEGETA